MPETKWIPINDELPPERMIVWTKISDDRGDRNEQDLFRIGNLWFLPDEGMYVYYTPTHWRKLNDA